MRTATHDCAVGQDGAERFDIDIGIIYTYERHYIEPLLDSLADSGDKINRRVILVDNRSDDGVDDLAARLPQTLVLHNTERLGYAANLNRILEASSARYVLLMNTDMQFEPGEQCLAKMVDFMDRTPECGLASCRLYHPEGTYLHPPRRFPTVSMILGRRLAPGVLFQASAQHHLYGEHDPRETFPCDWVTGCFMLVRRTSYLHVGGLDLRFRKYFDDTDYCRQMAEAGWQVMFHGETFAYHVEQRASKRWFSRDAATHLASYVKWLWKWRGHPPRPRRLRRPNSTTVLAGLRDAA